MKYMTCYLRISLVEFKKKKKAFTEGKAPGTLTPPWKEGGLVWKAFFDDHLSDALNIHAATDVGTNVLYEDGTVPPTSTFNYDLAEPDPKYPWLPILDPHGEEKLDQLEDPYQQEKEVKKKKNLYILFKR